MADVSILEGNDGNSNLEFVVSLSSPVEEEVTVNYSTSDDTAIAGTDYIAKSGSLTFAVGETEKTVTVEIVGDTEIEPDETFFFNLSNAEGVAIDDGEAVGTIINDDSENPTIKEALDIDGTGGELLSSDYTLINLYASFGGDSALFDDLLQNYGDILLGENATRTTGTELTNYLSSVENSLFDIDGNGTVETSDYTLLDLYGSFGADSTLLDTFLQQNEDVLLGEGATRTTGTALVSYFEQSLPTSNE